MFSKVEKAKKYFTSKMKANNKNKLFKKFQN